MRPVTGTPRHRFATWALAVAAVLPGVGMLLAVPAATASAVPTPEVGQTSGVPKVVTQKHDFPLCMPTAILPASNNGSNNTASIKAKSWSLYSGRL